jgi:hypothetical protein
MLAAFLLAASPALPAKGSDVGSCHWHFALLGLSDWHTQLLGLQEGSVSWLTHPNDTLVWRSVTSYAQRSSALPDVGYCTPSYDRASRSLYFEILRTFPRDLIGRGLGAARQLLDYGVWGVPPINGGNPLGVMPFIRAAWTAAWIVVLLAVIARSVRLGLFAVLALAYLCAYPAIQFDQRHYFHLAFLTWMPAGFILVFLMRRGNAVLALARAGKDDDWTESLGLPRAAAWRRAVAILGGIVTLVAAVLWGAGKYQERAVATLFAGYLRAPGVTAPVAASEQVDGRIRITYDGLAPAGDQRVAGGALRFELGGGDCGRTWRRTKSGRFPSGLHRLTVGVGGPARSTEFTKDYPLDPAHSGPVVLFLPLYYHRPQATHAWVELAGEDAACLGRAEWVDPERLPSLWVSARLRPGS